MIGEHAGRRFDWHPRLDPASLRYEVAPKGVALPASGRLWTPGPVLDQGREGACVGMGCAGEAAAQPVPVPGVTSTYARGWYASAKRRDQWPGEAYDGTSVLAGCLEGRARGLYSGFGWARSAEALAAGIVGTVGTTAGHDAGPAIIGVEWRSGSYETDELGILDTEAGDVVGGHCLVMIGYLPGPDDLTDEQARQLEEWGLLTGLVELDGPAFVPQNSWGLVFGKRGRALVPLDGVRRWVRAGAELALPQGRKLPARRGGGRRKGDAVADEETTPGGDRTLPVFADNVREGDRVLDPPDELGQESATVTAAPHVVTGARGRQVLVPTTAGMFAVSVGTVLTVRRPQ